MAVDGRPRLQGVFRDDRFVRQRLTRAPERDLRLYYSKSHEHLSRFIAATGNTASQEPENCQTVQDNLYRRMLAGQGGPGKF